LDADPLRRASNAIGATIAAKMNRGASGAEDETDNVTPFPTRSA
jgi:hypothetical protein